MRLSKYCSSCPHSFQYRLLSLQRRIMAAFACRCSLRLHDSVTLRGTFRRLQSTTASAREIDKVEESFPDVPAQVDPSLNRLTRLNDEEDGPLVFLRHDGEVYDEERIARDVSRMLPYLRDRMDHVRKPPARIFAFQESAISLRARYAEFGRDSGVNPGIMWPSKEELALTQQREKDLGIPTLQESWARVAEKKRAEEERFQQREAEVSRNMAKMADEIKAFRLKQKQAEDVVIAEKAKRVKVMEEAKELLGYQVDPRDKRFQELLEQKEKEAKKLAKAQKKKEGEAKAIARLTSVEE